MQSADAADAADASANATGSLRAVMTPRHLANTVWALARLSANEVQLTKETNASHSCSGLGVRVLGSIC